MGGLVWPLAWRLAAVRFAATGSRLGIGRTWVGWSCSLAWRLDSREIRRFERDVAGELVHVDIKKLGRTQWVEGGACTGSPPTRAAVPQGSRLCVHALAVDDHSRLAYSEVLDDERQHTCAELGVG